MSLLHLFSMEAETQTALLSDGLLTLEREPRNTDSLETLMRAAHSLKGAARIVQLSTAERLAHVMEDCFVAAQEGRLVLTSEPIEVLLQGVDMLTRIGQAARTDAAPVADMDTALDAVVTAIAAIAAPGTMPLTVQGEPVAGLMPVPSQSKPVPVRDEPMSAQHVLSPAQSRPELAAPAPPEAADPGRMVRVTAENLNRLMGLAGESLVESRWLEPFANALRQLKRSQLELAHVVERLRESLSGLDVPEHVAGDATAARRKV